MARQDTPGGGSATRVDALLMVGIVLLAFGLRLIYVWQLRASPLFEHTQMDELYHVQWAQAIAAGETFVEGPYFRAPLYPGFLGAIFGLFGQSYLVPRVVQAALGALSCAVLFLIGRRAFSRKVGATAGFVAATYWMLIYFDGELLIPSLIVFLDLLLIWLLQRAAQLPGKLRYGLVGIVLGLSALARPNVLIFGPAIVLWLVVTQRGPRRRALPNVVSVTAGCLLVVLPITARNYVVGGDTVLIASQGGVNFYIGNNAQSDGQTAIVPGTPGGWWEGYHAAIDRAVAARGHELRPSEVSQYYLDESLSFIREDPLTFLTLTLRKLRLFWSPREIGNNKDIYFWTERFAPIMSWLPLGFGLLGPLGLLGLVLCWRRRAELFPLWGFVLVYMLSVVAFFCTSRYRTPVLPILILFATHAVYQGIDALHRARWKPLASGLVVLAVAAIFVHTTPSNWNPRDRAQSFVMLGDAFDGEGQLEPAAECHRRATVINPEYLLARYKLGTSLARLGRLPEAIAELRLALDTPPSLQRAESLTTVAAVHGNLANALWQSGNPSEAVTHYRAALGIYPPDESIDTLFSFGRVLHAQGLFEEALDAFREFLAARPEDLAAIDYMSSLQLHFGLHAEAISTLRTALPLGNAYLASRLAFTLATCPEDDLRNGTEALQLARSICPAPQSCGPADLDALAAALAETGSFTEAVELAELALRRASSSPDPTDRELAAKLEERLGLYRLGQPFRLRDQR